MWTEDDVQLVPVEWLKPHEEIRIKPRDKLLDMTNRWGGFTKPILVDTHTGALLDGHHRLSVAKELGLKLIPAICLDYLNSELISLELWPNANIDSLEKADVIEVCLSNELYPPKTTKHVLIYDLPPILVTLDELS